MAKILIVDDSKVIRVKLATTLEAAGHTVLEAADGAEGLRLAIDNPDITLVIADYNIPLMDGVTMCARIHQRPGYERIPLFMLTSESSSQLKAEGKAAGVMAWIVKPFEPTSLVQLIEKVLRRPAPGPDSPAR